MRKFVSMLGLGLVVGYLGACGNDSETLRLDGGGVDATADCAAGVDGTIADAEGALDVGIDSSVTYDGSVQFLVVPPAGERFSPALPNASSLPSGVWYCDMGKVHWAQGEQGTGKCPICGMDLVQKP